jgi:probable rRNA maturation factor
MLSVEAILKAVCKEVGLPRTRVELSVNIVTPARMRILNKTYRGKDKPTDVLSFPLLTKREVSTRMKKSGILPIGDIFINRSDARQKLAFLVVHGFLHLLGYDHEVSLREEKKMFALQDKILATLGHEKSSHLRN